MKEAILKGVLKVCLSIAILCVVVYFVLAVTSIVAPGMNVDTMLGIAACAFMAAYIALIIGAASWMVLRLK